MTIHDIKLTRVGYFGHDENKSSPQDDESSTPSTKIDAVLEDNVTHHLHQSGIVIEIDSTLNSGSQSWIVISRGMKKYVNEFPEHKREIRSPRRRGWTKTKGTIHSVITITLNDCCADRLAEVERHSCR